MNTKRNIFESNQLIYLKMGRYFENPFLTIWGLFGGKESKLFHVEERGKSSFISALRNKSLTLHHYHTWLISLLFQRIVDILLNLKQSFTFLEAAHCILLNILYVKIAAFLRLRLGDKGSRKSLWCFQIFHVKMFLLLS